MPKGVQKSTNPRQGHTEASEFPHQHIVTELTRRLGCTTENEHDALTESELHFRHERMITQSHSLSDGKVRVRSYDWRVVCMSLPVTRHDTQHVLEEMFARAMIPIVTGFNNFEMCEELKTLPKALFVRLDRQVPTGLPAPHPVVDPVLCDAPVAFPEEIDFGKDGGFSKPLNKHCPREQYKLTGMLMGRNKVRVVKGETEYSERWAYVFNHAQDQWFRMCRDGSSRRAELMPINYSEVASVMNGDSSPSKKVYPLSLYYQQQPNLLKLIKTAPKICHDQRFNTLSDVIGDQLKDCRLLRESGRAMPQVLTGFTVFELHFKIVLIAHCRQHSFWFSVHRPCPELVGDQIRNTWRELDGEAMGSWVANAARCNRRHAKNLTPFRVMSTSQIFSEQWMLVMMCREGTEMDFSDCLSPTGQLLHYKNVRWLSDQGYFCQLWDALYPKYRNWFDLMTRERNRCVGISQEQAMMELWDRGGHVLCAFMLPESPEWRAAGFALLCDERASRAALRQHFMGVLPELTQEIDAANDLARKLAKAVLCRYVQVLRARKDLKKRMRAHFCFGDRLLATMLAHGAHVPRPPSPVDRAHARERLQPQVMSALLSKKLGVDDEGTRVVVTARLKEASDALNRQVDAQDEHAWLFTVRCMSCHKMVEFRCPRTPNEQVCIKCQRCANEMTATVPDPRRLAAVNTITDYALVINARKTLCRLRKAAQKRAETAKRATRHAAEQAAAQERRAARAAAIDERRRQEMDREAERAAAARAAFEAARAAFEAAEAERLEAKRAAHADFLRRQDEARVAERAAAQAEAEATAPAVAAARQERRDARAADRATRRANKKWVNPIKAEEERRARHSKEVADAETKAKKVHAEDEAKREAKREAAREAARVAQAEAAARTAEAEARATARAAERATEKATTEEAARRHLGSIDLARDRVSASLIHEAIAEVATEKVALAASSPPNKHAHGWAEAAKNVQKTMREVADADIAAKEAEDLDLAIAASLEDTHSSPSAASPPAASPSPPQFKNAPSRKQLRKLNQTHCWYFDRGKCRYGDKCEYLHAKPVAPAPVAPAPVAPAPVAPAPDEYDAGANTKCIICFEGDKDVVCLPCRHQCACSGCLDVVRRFGMCPMCREPIVEAFSVFIA